MERLVELCADVPEMLQAGYKAKLSKRLGQMLYFDYFEDELGFYRKLCISPGIKLSAAEQRRAEMEERRRREEEERKRREREWLATPKRRRGLVAQRALRVRGHRLIGSVFEYPDRPGIFVVLLLRVDQQHVA